jgi:hypothetical protein
VLLSHYGHAAKTVVLNHKSTPHFSIALDMVLG